MDKWRCRGTHRCFEISAACSKCGVIYNMHCYMDSCRKSGDACALGIWTYYLFQPFMLSLRPCVQYFHSSSSPSEHSYTTEGKLFKSMNTIGKFVSLYKFWVSKNNKQMSFAVDYLSDRYPGVPYQSASHVDFRSIPKLLTAEESCLRPFEPA
jgi:hypothetical protein